MRIFYNVLEMMVSAKSPSAERRKLSLNAEISKVYGIITIENMGRGLLWPAIGHSSKSLSAERRKLSENAEI